MASDESNEVVKKDELDKIIDSLVAQMRYALNEDKKRMDKIEDRIKNLEPDD